MTGAAAVDDALKLLGPGMPFLYAAATGIFFYAIDRSLSDEAKAAISGWLTGRSPHNVASAVRDVFDRVYDHPFFVHNFPFLRWQSIARVTAIALVVHLVFIHAANPKMFGWIWTYRELKIAWGWQFMTDVLSAYASIYIIRKALLIAGNRPIFALFTGALVNIFVLKLILTFFGFFYITDFGANIDTEQDKELRRIITFNVPSGEMTLAAFATHLWLVLFAIGLLALRLSTWLARAVGLTERVASDGFRRPVAAAGYVVAFVVFALTAWWG
jgi:hypothetical protein